MGKAVSARRSIELVQVGDGDGPPARGGDGIPARPWRARRRRERARYGSPENERLPHGVEDDTAVARGRIRGRWPGCSRGIPGRWVEVGRVSGWPRRDRSEGTAHEGESAAAEAGAEVESGEGEEELAEVARGRGVGARRAGGHVGSRRSAPQQLMRDGELGVEMARGEEAVMANLDEAPGQDVEDEAAEELLRGEGDAGVAAGAEGDAAGVEGDESVVADADPVRVLAEVAEDLVLVAEGGLAVDDPSSPMQGVEEASKAARIGEGRGGSVEAEPPLAVRAAEGVEELAAEQLYPLHEARSSGRGGEAAR